MSESSVCSSCPFRVSNHGKRVPKGWYSEANVQRLWRGISAGERLVCIELELTADQTAARRECVGALHLVVRHLAAAKEPTYARRAAAPLSAVGLGRWRSRLLPHEVTDSDTTISAPTGGALGVPWRCTVTNTDNAAEDKDPLN